MQETEDMLEYVFFNFEGMLCMNIYEGCDDTTLRFLALSSFLTLYELIK